MFLFSHVFVYTPRPDGGFLCFIRSKNECKFECKINKPLINRGFCDPGGIQTPDFQNRNLTFYSAELRGRKMRCKNTKPGPKTQPADKHARDISVFCDRFVKPLKFNTFVLIMENNNKPSLLVVDDQPTNLIRLREILRRCQAEIYTADDPYKALEIVKTVDLALIILDIEMPGMNGFELAEHIRQTGLNNQTPLIFLTGVHSDELSIYKGYQTGAVDFLTKPVLPEILVGKANVFLRIKRNESELQRARERYLNIIEDQTDFILRMNPDFTISFANRSVCALAGKEQEGLLGTNMFDLLRPGDLGEAHRALDQLSPSNPIVRFEHSFDLGERPGQILLSHILRAFYDAAGNIMEYQSVCRDITIEKRDLQQLRDDKAKAEEASLNKSRFLANMSHEIRTPMSGILGMTEMLRTTALDAEQAEAVDLMHQSANNLLSIINEILDFSRIEANQVRLLPKETNIRELVRETAGLFRPRAAGKGLGIVTNVDARIPRVVMTDPLRLGQILGNLLNNAIKYSEQGEISITVNLKSNESGIAGLWFGVKDRGPGIPPELQNDLFQPFYQVQPSETKTEGTGLGLAISKSLVCLLGGQIGLTSLPGSGSEFWFTIQVQMMPAGENTPQPHEPPAPLAGKRPLQVLIVEDNILNQKVAAATLNKLGHSFGIAANGEIALNMVKQATYDLIIMDIQMPVMNGLEATRHIRAHEAQNGMNPVKIIALTANAMASDRKACLEAGMDDYISKPFRFEDFQKTLARHF